MNGACHPHSKRPAEVVAAFYFRVGCVFYLAKNLFKSIPHPLIPI